jgi:hypothetical protein
VQIVKVRAPSILSRGRLSAHGALVPWKVKRKVPWVLLKPCGNTAFELCLESGEKGDLKILQEENIK